MKGILTQFTPDSKIKTLINRTKMNSSIYIPRMPSSRTAQEVVAAFKENDIGIVSRVDFTPINKRPGFGEDVDMVVKSAFVHFSVLYGDGQCLIYWATLEGKAFKFLPFENSSEYWLILPAKNPIPDTMMNTAQIVENCRLLEKKVEEQDAKIKKLEEKLEGVHQVVYQLVGGLFNQTTQGKTIDAYLSILLPGEQLYKNPFESVEEESKWEDWATTRQGDANEERIARLEKIVLGRGVCDSELSYSSEDDEQEDTALFERKREVINDESDSNSTHSSIPDLLSCVSSSSYSR